MNRAPRPRTHRANWNWPALLTPADRSIKHSEEPLGVVRECPGSTRPVHLKPHRCGKVIEASVAVGQTRDEAESAVLGHKGATVSFRQAMAHVQSARAQTRTGWRPLTILRRRPSVFLAHVDILSRRVSALDVLSCSMKLQQDTATGDR